jgi:hypothetical protein
MNLALPYVDSERDRGQHDHQDHPILELNPEQRKFAHQPIVRRVPMTLFHDAIS